MKIVHNNLHLFFVIFFICLNYTGNSQTILEGYVLDSVSKKPLPYAAILFGELGYYTTANEDGKFRITSREKIDSVEIRYLGYQRKKFSKDYLLSHRNLYLQSVATKLREVVVEVNKSNTFNRSKKGVNYSNESDLYDLLFRLIKKYRKSNDPMKSKAYFSLTSKAYLHLNKSSGSIPLEQIEGLYNSKHSLSEGIIDLHLKTGRFGQNKKAPFYSLDYIKLLQNHSLFKKNFQILPKFPGNMSLRKTKKKYLLKAAEIKDYDGFVMEFTPKLEEGEFFSGRFLFQKDSLIIEKIELSLNNPEFFRLNSIVKGDSISVKKIDLTISFNPIDLSKIQYYNLDFDLTYITGTKKDDIRSNAILYFYDYDDHFEKPYFTNSIDFKNDYDRLLALTASNRIWEEYYPFPRSKRNIEVINFFKDKRQLYNYYENQIPQKALAHIKTSSINWSPKGKLVSQDIKIGPGINLDFSYALNQYRTSYANYEFTLGTLFDTQSSFFKEARTYKDLACINLAFDIYESNRRKLLSKITPNMTLQEVKDLCNATHLDAKITIKMMLKECLSEISDYNFSKWNERIQAELNKFSGN